MSYAYKPIKAGDIARQSFEVHKEVTIISSSNSIFYQGFKSGSLLETGSNPSGSYYNSLLFNFYSSASSDVEEYKKDHCTVGLIDRNKPQHRNKFHKTGSVISIPQHLFGDKIMTGSFSLTSTTSSANGTGSIQIVDDGRGNLYSTNAHNSRSLGLAHGTGSMSSSHNYVGNIFYSLGLAVLTETSSWSGSGTDDVINYTDILTHPNYRWSVNFKSSQLLSTTEYNLVIKSHELNSTNNVTARKVITSSHHPASGNLLSSHILKDELTGSNWKPYLTTIGLYNDDHPYPVMIARLSQPIKMTDSIDLIFKIRQDF